jgi:hypothetical protein
VGSVGSVGDWETGRLGDWETGSVKIISQSTIHYSLFTKPLNP